MLVEYLYILLKKLNLINRVLGLRVVVLCICICNFTIIYKHQCILSQWY